MTRTVVFLLLLTTAAGPGFAITLDEAVEQALRGNPGLEAARAEWQAAETRKTQVTTLPDPTVEFTFGSSGAEYEGELRSIAIGQALPFPAKVRKARSWSLQQVHTMGTSNATWSKVSGGHISTLL
jgi:outer membrane protein TolC